MRIQNKTVQLKARVKKVFKSQHSKKAEILSYRITRHARTCHYKQIEKSDFAVTQQSGTRQGKFE